MFNNLFIEDLMVQVLGDLFRLPVDGKPITVMQLAGFPAEVVDSLVSVLCRMGFEFGVWSDGAAPLLVACEEAHRYAPADRKLGFGPTRKALSRIAKEGRKYGVFLGLITQRPAEIDPTILSQCSTVFAMRLANDIDQAIVKSAVPDAGSSLVDFLPSLGNREGIAFGEGVPLPTRFRFTDIAADRIPRSQSGRQARLDVAGRHRRRFHSSRGRSLARRDHHQPAAAHQPHGHRFRRHPDGGIRRWPRRAAHSAQKRLVAPPLLRYPSPVARAGSGRFASF